MNPLVCERWQCRRCGGDDWRACMSCCEGARRSAGGAPEACTPTELVSGACLPCTQQPVVKTHCVQVRCSALMLVRKSAVCARYLAPVLLKGAEQLACNACDVFFECLRLMPASVLAAQDDARAKRRRSGKAEHDERRLQVHATAFKVRSGGHPQITRGAYLAPGLNRMAGQCLASAAPGHAPGERGQGAQLLHGG